MDYLLRFMYPDDMDHEREAKVDRIATFSVQQDNFDMDFSEFQLMIWVERNNEIRESSDFQVFRTRMLQWINEGPVKRMRAYDELCDGKPSGIKGAELLQEIVKKLESLENGQIRISKVKTTAHCNNSNSLNFETILT